MSSLGYLMDAFERVMAAVAFAEHDDRKTACWILRSEGSTPTLRPEATLRVQRVRQPELRM